MNDCLNINATAQQFLEQNMLTKIKEIDDEIILRYIAEKTP
jgi:uncharacterized protein (DUF2164 family)